MSAPAGLSFAGYIDPHCIAHPMSFQVLGERKQPMIDTFVSNLIVIDVDCLKPDGRNCAMLITCAAIVIGWYNNLV